MALVAYTNSDDESSNEEDYAEENQTKPQLNPALKSDGTFPLQSAGSVIENNVQSSSKEATVFAKKIESNIRKIMAPALTKETDNPDEGESSGGLQSTKSAVGGKPSFLLSMLPRPAYPTSSDDISEPIITGSKQPRLFVPNTVRTKKPAISTEMDATPAPNTVKRTKKKTKSTSGKKTKKSKKSKLESETNVTSTSGATDSQPVNADNGEEEPTVSENDPLGLEKSGEAISDTAYKSELSYVASLSFRPAQPAPTQEPPKPLTKDTKVNKKIEHYRQQYLAFTQSSDLQSTVREVAEPPATEPEEEYDEENMEEEEEPEFEPEPLPPPPPPPVQIESIDAEAMFSDERFRRLHGAGGKHGWKNQFKKGSGGGGGGSKDPMDPIEFVDVRQDSQVDKIALKKALTEEAPRQSFSKKRNKDMPSFREKRKHQITYLAYQAKEREIELKNDWATSRQTRRETQSKYGF